MTMRIETLAAVVVGAVLATSALAQSAKEVRGPSTFVPVEKEPAPGLIVDPPLPGPLARGAVLIPYRVENVRILPVLGAGGLGVSLRAGHLHSVTVTVPSPTK